MKSDLTWKEGNECIRLRLANTASNRIYYAVFQAIKCYGIAARVLSEDGKSDVHAKAADLASAQTKGKEYRETLSLLRSLRVKADYQVGDVEQTKLEGLLIRAEEMRAHFIGKALKHYDAK